MASGRCIRFYVPTLHEGELSLPEDEARHARTVLRLAAGDGVELFDGRGHVAQATVVAAEKRNVRLDAGAVSFVSPVGPAVHVAFAIPKGKRLDWLLEKATELGASSLVPIVFARSVAGGDSLKASKRDRWQMQCVAAAKQSGLNTLPTLGEMEPLAAYLATPARGLRLFGDLDDAASLREALATSPAAESIELLVGPEGGFTDEERAAILASGATPIRLGETTLRTETAVVALLAGVRAVL